MPLLLPWTRLIVDWGLAGGVLHASAVMPFAVRLKAFAERPQSSGERGLRFLERGEVGVLFSGLLNRYRAGAFHGEFGEHANALADLCLQLYSLGAGLFCTKHITDEMPKNREGGRRRSLLLYCGQPAETQQ